MIGDACDAQGAAALRGRSGAYADATDRTHCCCWGWLVGGDCVSAVFERKAPQEARAAKREVVWRKRAPGAKRGL
jgi:hypothetical protein